MARQRVGDEYMDRWGEGGADTHMKGVDEHMQRRGGGEAWTGRGGEGSRVQDARGFELC